jgi:PEP-CTERM motif
MLKGTIAIALLLHGLPPVAAFAAPVTFNFSGQADTAQTVAGNFNSAWSSGDSISGSVTFDGSLFTQLASSYFATQEYPDAFVSFTLMGGAPVQTKPVVEDTYYDDLRLVTNPSASGLYWSNLSSTEGIFNGAYMQLQMHVDREVDALSDIPGHVDQIEFVWQSASTNGFVHRYYTDIAFTSTSTQIPEPGTWMLVLAGLAAIGVTPVGRRRVAGQPH